ncbi:MAG: sterol desaturase [Sphingomonas sp. 12-62-6]|nr:MAG: sterol desaturase [Sphingomonas sp. 12-62-6]
MIAPGAAYLAIRLGCFAGVLVLMATLERLRPRRTQILARVQRWPGNLALIVIDSIAARLVLAAAAIGVAALSQAQGWGLLELVALPGWVEIVLAIMLLDLVIYGQHVAFHSVPWLWRVHRMHHSDPEIDVTTALRFHPVEIILSLAIKGVAIAAIGASPLAVLIFEIVLNATAMFNHSNIALPLWLDALLRRVLVAPDMHRVHHSVGRAETNSNFGFNLPWWDWLFGTYRAQPAAGHNGMTIGLEEFRGVRDQRIDQLLVQPLRGTSIKGADHG